MKVRLLEECDSKEGIKPAGTEIDHPEAFRLCELGVAEPIDEAAQRAYAHYQARQERQALLAARAAEVKLQQEQAAAEVQEKLRLAQFEKMLRDG